MVNQKSRTIRLKGFMETIRLSEALKRFREEARLPRLRVETVPLTEAVGRVLAEDVFAFCDVPPFDRAAMDGYATKAENTYGASPSNPLVFQLRGKVDVGEIFKGEIGGGEVVQVGTGAPLPKGANAVVMFEFTRSLEDGKIEIYQPVTPGENVARKGEDYKAGERVFPKGLILQPQDVAALAALGLREVKVKAKPKVAILSVGRELVEPGSEVGPGQIYDANRYFLKAALAKLGCEVLDLGIASDHPKEIKAKILGALGEADLLITAGGTSAGSSDLTLEALSEIEGFHLIFHGVSIRPGRPLASATINGKPIIMLPGYPAAAILTFQVFVEPVIGWMLEAELPAELKVWGRLTRRVPSRPGVLDLVRVRIKPDGEGGFLVEPLRAAGAGVISSVVKANGLLLIPEGREGYEEGEMVEVRLLRSLWGVGA